MVSLTLMGHSTLYATSVLTRMVPPCTGELSGRVSTDAPPSTHSSTIAVDGLGEVLRCPWHQWAFDIATGRCLVDPEIRAKTYPVKIKDDDVVVEYED